jgi:murein DD-endopeptidase MepM/ murein hydrolase activator NlpD
MGRRKAFARIAATGLALALPAPATAAAQAGTGGATPTPAPPVVPSGSPVPALLPAAWPLPALPVVRAVRCLRACPAAAGSRLRLRGRTLRRAYEIVFQGAPGDDDDVSGVPLRRTRRTVDVTIPLGAASGPVAVIERDGTASAPGPALVTIQPGAGMRALALAGAGVELQVQSRRAFFDAARPARLLYVVHGGQPADVVAEVVREADGTVVARWSQIAVPPETVQSFGWDGTAGGAVQREGRYRFRVSAGGDRTRAASSAEEADAGAFVLLRHAFPVQGPHGFGGPVARFGGARRHQGQDVFAACGTPLVAARGGVVKHTAFEAAAGNYVVIDGERTGTDYAYMHLRDPALVEEGERVRTGQLIGAVGETGHADGCHLHLELWSKPGWYSGGAPFDPLPSLLDWDRRS